jgi:murein L,D-transpeptidase YcbB/YkuD
VTRDWILNDVNYLHDTPNHDLFARAERDCSHGCFRLSEPAQLAEWILARDQSDWDKTRIDTVFASQSRTVKNLNTPLPVHITYETAWIDGDSRLRFVPDIYGA